MDWCDWLKLTISVVFMVGVIALSIKTLMEN